MGNHRRLGKNWCKQLLCLLYFSHSIKILWTQELKACMLYISTSIWVLPMPNSGQNSHFQRFLWQKAFKKARNLQQNSSKTGFLKFAPQTLVECFIPKKNSLKMTILTRVWRAPHPNAGQNIQHLYEFWHSILSCWVF